MNLKSIPITWSCGALMAGLTLSSLLFGTVSSATAEAAGTPVGQSEVRPQQSFAKLAKALKPAVVNIVVEKVVTEKADTLGLFGDSFDERGSKRPRFQPTQTGQGSGVLISKNGYILTNNHVVSDAKNVKVTLSDGRELQAKVIGSDPKTDVALVKIEGGDNLPFASLGNSDDLEVGDWVMAIGNPFGLEATVTVGVLSGKGRVIGSGPYDDYLQTDASINPGNSGGPLFNTDGKVVGINTAIISGSQGIGFSIPINQAVEVEQQLMASGHVVRGFLGLGVQELEPRLSADLKIPAGTRGALVAQVVPQGPASAAGIKVEDVVTAINGKPVQSDRDLMSQAARLPVGKAAQLTLLREGRELTLAVAIVERPEDKKAVRIRRVEPQSHAPVPQESLGIDVAPLSSDIAAELQTSDLKGVVVAEIASNSIAQRAGLERGDIIRKVNNHDVSSLDDFVKIVHQEESGAGVALLIERKGSSRFVVLEI